MTVINLLLPLPFSRLVRNTSPIAANDAAFDSLWNATSTATIENLKASNQVRLLRHAKEQDTNRFALTGKLSDVCAALDELAQLEEDNMRRCIST